MRDLGQSALRRVLPSGGSPFSFCLPCPRCTRHANCFDRRATFCLSFTALSLVLLVQLGNHRARRALVLIAAMAAALTRCLRIVFSCLSDTGSTFHEPILRLLLASFSFFSSVSFLYASSALFKAASAASASSGFRSCRATQCGGSSSLAARALTSILTSHPLALLTVSCEALISSTCVFL